MKLRSGKTYEYKETVRKSRNKKRISKPTKGLKKAIKKVVVGMAEKESNWEQWNQQAMLPYDVAGTNPPTILDLSNVLALAQGTDNGQREGNQFRIKSLRLRGTFYFNQTTAEPVKLKVMIGRLKNGVQSPFFSDYANMFIDGPNRVAPSNTILDIHKTIDQKYWSVKKQLKLNMGANQNPSTTPPTSSYHQQYKNSQDINLDLKKLVPEVVKFTDSSNIPQNVGLYLWIVGGYANGTVITPAIPFCDFTGIIELKYTDF